MSNTNSDTGPLQRSSLMALRLNSGPSHGAVGDTDGDAARQASISFMIFGMSIKLK